MTSAVASDQVTDVQLARYAKLIYERTGIRISPQKKTLLSNRLRRRLRATGLKDFDDYYRHISKLSDKDPEWDGFLQDITTHETYLFRDEGQWNWLKEQYLPEIAAQARAGERQKRLKIWSAACSTGDEAHTIACCIADRLMNCSDWSIEILGTDIGVEAVKAAKNGVFGERAMRLVPDGYRRRFFSAARDSNVWTARPNITSWMRFRQHNLLEPMRDGPFDLIFLKNVLIYFDRASKQNVLEHIRKALRVNGFLITGAAEGISDLIRGEMEHVQPWLHRNPAPK